MPEGIGYGPNVMAMMKNLIGKRQKQPGNVQQQGVFGKIRGAMQGAASRPKPNMPFQRPTQPNLNVPAPNIGPGMLPPQAAQPAQQNIMGIMQRLAGLRQGMNRGPMQQM